MTSNPANRLHPSLQFLILTAITIGVVLLGNLIGAAVVAAFYDLKMVMNIAQLDFSAPGTANALWILQILGTTIPLLITPLVFAQFIVKQPQEYLKPSFNFPWTMFALVFCVMMVSSPLIELLSRINQDMVLPDYLSGVQKWMRDSEDNAEKLIKVLLKMDTIFGVIANVIAVGLFTAIVEELMFRGCVQTIFIKWTGNVHAAVWITAILFSAFHMEFFGFLPRVLLGVLFGYFTAWSGSVWPAVWAHFLNNATAVVAVYLYQHKLVKIDPNDMHIFKSSAYVFSFIIVLFLLFLYHKEAKKEKTAA
ncbi:CPBP family intramembrane glutamic endopeptidase [Mucilaginibacter sp. HD30]